MVTTTITVVYIVFVDLFFWPETHRADSNGKRAEKWGTKSVTRGFVLTIYAQTTNTDDTTFLNKQSFIYTITYLARIRDMNRLAKEIATIRRYHQYCGVRNIYCYTC